MNKIQFFLILLLSVIFTDKNSAQTSTRCKDVFTSDKLLNVSIITELNILLKDVGEDRKYHNAAFIYNTSIKDSSKRLSAKLKTRGHFRRNRKICDFPPIKIKFDKEEIQNTEFRNYKKLKLVTHCRSRFKNYEQGVLPEYLAYKIYNILSNQSYRVRLAKIKYIDSEGKQDPIEKFAFFIESKKNLLKRLNSKEIEQKNYFHNQLDRSSIILFSMFQYMIGNTDWSVPGLHNTVLVKSYSCKCMYAIPYDFDWAGLVNSSYAVPYEKLPIKTVRERLYRGFKYDKKDYTEAVNKFRKSKSEIYKLIEQFPYLQPKKKKSTLSYLDSFYKIIENDKRINSIFIEGAREF